MVAGLTPEGFTVKSLNEIRANITANLEVALGSSIETGPSSRIGQFIDIVSYEIYSCWLALEAVYNSWYPDTASGTSLDNVCAITNTSRLHASSSFAPVYYGAGESDSGKIVPTGTLVGKAGTSVVLAQTSPDILITVESNLFLCSAQPVDGILVLRYETSTPGVYDQVSITYNFTEEQIRTELVTKLPISNAVVVGTLASTSGFHVHIIGDSIARTILPIVFSNTLLDINGQPVAVTTYWSNDDGAEASSLVTGPITLPPLTITTMISTISYVTAVVNFLAGSVGTEGETDADLRARRYQELQKSGTVTPNGIKEAVLGVAGVSNVSIIENATANTAAGRPPHTYEVYVTGGDNNAVAQKIYDTKPVGISPVRTTSGGSQRSGVIVDVNGNQQVLLFSAPVQVPVYIQVNITTLVGFPVDGVDQIKDALILYFSNYELGDDVYNHKLYSPINTVPGIATLTILSDSADPPSSSNNVTISPEQVAVTAAQWITVVVT